MSETMTSAQVRESFIKFFESKGHLFVRSSPVVPHDDPTLMFTNAGMNQFKAIFLGDNPKGWKRVCNSQKCIRVSGKHNDLDVVGRDNYHHTFFEMLGNWSFGDYYKKEAITWAWELLTEVWKLPKERLFATVFEDDDEAWQIWKDVSGLPDDRIMRFDAHSNFWEMGDTGPCGPCSEIHYDRGDLSTQAETFKDPILGVNGENDRYIEIWNNVFMQYERLSDGSLAPLKAKNVDTGMGFERICAILQGKTSNYDTDVFSPIIQKIAELSGVPYAEGKDGTPHRVIADHLRALSFAIADGALPSNEGRGYVLRRILRRASRFARLLGQKTPFICKLVQVLSDTMGDAFPEIRERKDFVASVIQSEEESFIRTLDAGLERFATISAGLERGAKIPGDKVFLLYDTYGFPPDLTGILAEEKGLLIDEDGYEKCMKEQKERARANMKKGIDTMGSEGWTEYAVGSTKFVGYEADSATAKVLRYREDKGILSIVLDTTPFYAEMGGQVGDKGLLESGNLKIAVFDTVRVNDTVVHRGKVLEGAADTESMSKEFSAKVDIRLREDIRANHSATHLLQAALRQVLGSHVAQQGSRVEPTFLRFDFSHFQAMTKEEIERVEDLVNDKIRETLPVHTDVMNVDEARASGAMALFGEKYGEEVRVVKMGTPESEFSKELCGGLHVKNTGAVGIFKIVSEASVSSGVRRIEAVTGRAALGLFRMEDSILNVLREKLRAGNEAIVSRFETTLENSRKLEKELSDAKLQIAASAAEQLLKNPEQVGEAKLYIRDSKMPDAGFKILLDGIGQRLAEDEMVVIGNVDGSVGSIAVLVGKALQKRGIKAGDLVKELAAYANGRGGGRPDRAQAGTRDVGKVSDAIHRATGIVKGKLGV